MHMIASVLTLDALQCEALSLPSAIFDSEHGQHRHFSVRVRKVIAYDQCA